MKKAKVVSLFGALLLSMGMASAQVGKPLDQPSKKPVLYDDVHQGSLKKANEDLLNTRVSMTKLLPGLTAKQKRTILALERKRDGQLQQIGHQIAAQSAQLSALQTEAHPDAKAISGTKAKIAKLQAQRKEVAEATQKKIRTLLTGQQKSVFDHIYKK